MNIIAKIKRFFKYGYVSFKWVMRPNTYLKYLMYYPLNWMWVLGSLVAIGMFIRACYQYQAEVFLWLAGIPFTLLIYQLIDEYYAFQHYSTGKRDVSATLLRNLTATICSLILVYIILRIQFE